MVSHGKWDWRWHGGLALAALLCLVSAGYLLVAPFGGWYYEHRWQEHRYDAIEQRSVLTPLKSQSWEADGLWNEPAIAAPLAFAVVALLAAAGSLAWLLARPGAAVRRYLGVSLLCVAAAWLLVEGTAVAYALASAEASEWWFEDAYWASTINTSLAALLLGFLAWKRRRPSLDRAVA